MVEANGGGAPPRRLAVDGQDALRRGDFAAAEAALRALAALTPSGLDPWLGLAALWVRAGRADAGLAAATRARRLAPEPAEVLLACAGALLGLGRLAEAEAAVGAALVRLPSSPSALTRLGEIRIAQGRLDEALIHLSQAVAADPQSAAAHAALGHALRGLGLLSAAVARLETALRLEPGRIDAGRRRAAALFEAGRIDEGMSALDALAPVDPQPAVTGSIRLFSLNLDDRLDDAALLAAHRAWGERTSAAHPSLPPLPPLPARPAGPDFAGPDFVGPDPADRLRIGYVAADVRRHPVGYMLEAALRHADRAAFDIAIYAGNLRDDVLTERLRGLCGTWRACAGWSDERLARTIREDRIDILVDLSGHAGGNRLPVFARKPAPIQVSWLDYFNTTGLPEMDYALFDPVSVPNGRERWFTEQVVRLPDGRFCYTPPDYAPDPAPPPVLNVGSVTFGSFNSLQKLNEPTIALWSRALRAVPGAKLLLKTAALVDLEAQMALRLAFRRHGVGGDRLILRGRSDHPAMLAEYGDIDVALDPLGYNGGITSCEALWMGVPTLTLPGARPVARQTLSFLTALGLTEDLVAEDEDDFVAKAAALAADPGRLARLRAGLRGCMAASPLCDGRRFAGRLEAAYHGMRRRRAAGLPPAAFDVPAAPPAATAVRERASIEDAPTSAQSLFENAAADHMAGRFAAARAGYERLRALLPQEHSFTPLYLSGLLEMDDDAPAAAAARLAQIPILPTTEAFTRSAQALAALMLGDEDAATEGFAAFMALRGEAVPSSAALRQAISRWRRSLEFAARFKHLKGAVGLGLGDGGYAAEPVAACCPACGGQAAKRLFSVTATQAAQHFIRIDVDPERFERLRLTLERAWSGKPCRLLRCDACGLGFADPFVAGDADFYELTSADALYPSDKWEFDATLTALRALRPADPTQGLRVLEIGSGDGAFLRKLSPALTPPGAVHFAEYVVKHRSRLAQEGFIPFDPAAVRRPPPELLGRFDAVCAFQVLEHVDGLDAWVDGLSALLRPGGGMFLAMPGDPFTAFAENGGAGLDMPPNHLTRWTPAALAALARRRGLEMAACSFDKDSVASRRRQFCMQRFARDAQIPGSVAQAVSLCPVDRLSMQLMTQLALMYEIACRRQLDRLEAPLLGPSLWAHLTKPA